MARRWIFYLALNIIVSAATMLAVLYLWDRSHRPAPAAGTPTLQLPHGNFTPKPTIYPTYTPFLYTVKSGDTLGGIAAQFGISIDELVALNNIEDPNWLEPGMKLIIPAGGAPNQPMSDHPTVTPQEGEPFPWPAVGTVMSPGNLFLEAVQVINPGPDAELTGWRLRSPSGAEYVFGKVTLFSKGAVILHTAEGIDTAIDLYWNLKEALWQPGDEVQLLDSMGNLRSTFVIP